MMQGPCLAVRAELGLSGFVALDIFQMLSQDTCRSMGLPAGAAFWAPQTVSNLCACSLGTIAMILSKDPRFNPWENGSARATEITVEEWFSQLRGQSNNAQLTCRSFWQAAARVACKNGRLLTEEKPHNCAIENPLTHEEFLLKIASIFFQKCDLTHLTECFTMLSVCQLTNVVFGYIFLLC